MKLVFIHGRSQQGKNPVELKKTWEAALLKGLSKAGLPWPGNLTVSFPFYGDLLDELVKKVNSPLVAEYATKGPPAESQELSFRYEFLSELQAQQGISDEDVKALVPAGQPLEKGPLNWGWVHAILKALDKTPLGDVAIDKFTRDVFVYLSHNNVANAINNVVLADLKEPCVVVAHSLGTIVGYNSLSKIPATTKVSKYITLGSPLGVKAIRSKLKTPLSMPACTPGWFNARDPDDVVALYPLDQSHFAITPAIVNKNDVNNTTDNQHSIEGYLDDPEIARQIYLAISGA